MTIKLYKYVIINSISPVTFRQPLSHKDMQKLGPVTSAGYYARDAMGNVTIAGESLGTNIPIGNHDKELLEKFFEEEH